MQLKEFDAFPKVESGFTKRTGSGGVLTLVVTTVLCFLVLGELRDYWRLRNDYTFLVDPLVGHHLKINLDITVAMPCSALTIDLRDVADQTLHLSETVQKIATKFTPPAHTRMNREKEDINVRRLIKAAQKKAQVDSTKYRSEELTACRIAGNFEANKLSGNMHITAQGHGYAGAHLDHNMMNMTHKIDELSFGEFYPQIVNPLDYSLEVSETQFEAFQYFLTVVPTVYIDRTGRQLLSNQYSVSEHRRRFEEHAGVPGIFFKYDIEPLTLVIKEEYGMTFGHLLVRLAGLVGGYYVTAGMAYKVFSAVVSHYRPEKPQLRI